MCHNTIANHPPSNNDKRTKKVQTREGKQKKKESKAKAKKHSF
jgi:hypothetical protein